METQRIVPQTVQRVVLTGFMGSGKTTVGRLLAERLGWRFADLDEAVSTREGLSIPEIFAQRGETVFRKVEAKALAELVRATCSVIALGGGAPETALVRALLRQARGTLVVHLYAPFELLYARCLTQADDPTAVARPLAHSREAAAARYERRLAVYAEIAGHTADAGLSSPLAVVEAILDLLKSQVSSS